jgi:uncharacterized protein
MVGTSSAFPFLFFRMKILEDELPLFPLHTVLFPQARLPLYIFEARYREMIERCLRENLAFGVVLIKEGVEVGGTAIPYAIGTIAHIVDVDRLADGRLNIVVKGVVRFKLLEQHLTHAYLTGRVQVLFEEPAREADPGADYAQAARLFEIYIRAVQALGESDSEANAHELNLPRDPAMLSYLIAAILPLNPQDKQGLLELPTAQMRLTHEIELIQREQILLRLVSEPSHAVRAQGSFSLN